MLSIATLSPMRNDGRYPPPNLGRKVIMVIQIGLYSMWLKIANWCSRRPVTGSCDVDVSVTTFGDRTRRAYQTLETIGRGTILPRNLVLWLEDEATVNDPPRALRRLQKRGLTIRQCEGYGPHTKYFPYVVSEKLERPLVTADDDQLYPRRWLADLVAAHQPDEVTAYRARIINDGPYTSWSTCTHMEASGDLLALGVSGVIYPAKVLVALRERGDSFMRVCPNADDFWLHYAAVASGVLTRQVSDVPARWWPVQPLVASTAWWRLRPKKRGLWIENQIKGGNDAISGAVADEWLER